MGATICLHEGMRRCLPPPWRALKMDPDSSFLPELAVLAKTESLCCIPSKIGNSERRPLQKVSLDTLQQRAIQFRIELCCRRQNGQKRNLLSKPSQRRSGVCPRGSRRQTHFGGGGFEQIRDTVRTLFGHYLTRFRRKKAILGPNAAFWPKSVRIVSNSVWIASNSVGTVSN